MAFERFIETFVPSIPDVKLVDELGSGRLRIFRTCNVCNKQKMKLRDFSLQGREGKWSTICRDCSAEITQFRYTLKKETTPNLRTPDLKPLPSKWATKWLDNVTIPSNYGPNRTGREWHEGPPPHIGWWNASVTKNIHSWRWWDGRRWSASAMTGDSQDYAVTQSRYYAAQRDQAVMLWADYWPEDARVPRINSTEQTK